MQYLRLDSIRRWVDGDYTVTTDPEAVDLDVVFRFLRDEAYWWHGRPRSAVEHVIAASRTYTLRHEPSNAQVGFARVVTDGSWYAWLGDVFVLASHRGGRGKFLMRSVMEDLEPVRLVTLGTRDAHGLYAQFGFTPVQHPEARMERFHDAADQ